MKKSVLSVLTALVLLVCLSVALCACVPSNVEKAEEKMREADYSVSSYDVEKEDSEDGMTDVFTAVKVQSLIPLNAEYIFVFFFDSSAHAKDYAEKAKEHATDYLPGVLTKAFVENGEVGVSGKCVYYGSTEAVEVFKK